MNYNWTNNAYWLLRIRLKPAAWADQQYGVGHDLQKNPTAAVQCDYNVSIRVLQEYVKTQHPGNLTTSEFRHVLQQVFTVGKTQRVATLRGHNSFNFMT